MSTSSADQPGSGIVTFTQEGDRALDHLAADLVDHCDGSTASIADILEHVLSADIAELADNSADPPSPARPAQPPRVQTMQPVDASAPTGPFRRRTSPATPDRPLTRRSHARELLRPQ